MRFLLSIVPDKFSVALVSTMLLASLFPISGQAAVWFGYTTNIAVALLFFLHGVNLPVEALVNGLTQWRLHGLVLLSTFVLFPLLGEMVQWVPASILTPSLAMGVLYLCCLPSTVQSSIAFTSIARGNVPAAICSASLSNLVGVVATPLMVGLLLQAKGGGVSFQAVENIILQILVPFAIGQILHGRLGEWAKRRKPILGIVDRGSILMVVFGAFSEAMTHHLWQQLPLSSLAVMLLVNLVLLGSVLFITAKVGEWAHLSLPDRITLLFCGSKKSLASGVPMANILFPPAMVGAIVLPVMLFHQIQLLACAVLARRYAKLSENGPQARSK